MIDLSAFTYVAVATIVVGGILGAWSQDAARRKIAQWIAVLGVVLLGAAASRWWGSAELESAALVVFAIAVLRTSDGDAGDR